MNFFLNYLFSQCIRPMMTDEASQMIAEAYADLRTVDLDENRAR
jgi:DNA replicative helicase MCM subunit Mcm2 (Cdc46/Mcm family)